MSAGRGGGDGQARVRLDLAGERRSDAEGRQGIRGGRDRGEPREQVRAGARHRGVVGQGEGVEVERGPGAGCGLALGGRQQDQHRASLARRPRTDARTGRADVVVRTWHSGGVRTAAPHPRSRPMTAMNVFGVVYPFVLLVIAAAVWLGIRSSGRERTHASALEQRLRERTFTGQDRVTLEWPRDRRRPSLAKVVSIGESYGYRLLDKREREHVVELEFERILDDEGF